MADGKTRPTQDSEYVTRVSARQLWDMGKFNDRLAQFPDKSWLVLA